MKERSDYIYYSALAFLDLLESLMNNEETESDRYQKHVIEKRVCERLIDYYEMPQSIIDKEKESVPDQFKTRLEELNWKMIDLENLNEISDNLSEFAGDYSGDAGEDIDDAADKINQIIEKEELKLKEEMKLAKMDLYGTVMERA